MIAWQKGKAMVTDEHVRFIKAVRMRSRKVYSECDLPEFCNRMGIRRDSYAEELFAAFGCFHKGLMRFDPETFARLLFGD